MSTTKKRSPPSPTPIDAPPETVTFVEYVRNLLEAGDGRKPTAILRDVSQGAGVGYATVQRHFAYGTPLTVPTAKKLEAWSGGKISAAKTLGVAR